MSFCLKVDREAENDFEFVRNLAIFRLKSICSLVFSYITHEDPTITFDKLYELLELDRERLEHCVFVIGYIFSECIKHRINPYDFCDVILPAKFNENTVAVLSQFYDRINLALKKQGGSDSSSQESTARILTNVRWRLDVEISNQCLNRVYNPSYLIELGSSHQGGKLREYFEVDYSTLKTIRDTLQNSIQTSWKSCCNDFRYIISANYVCLLSFFFSI